MADEISKEAFGPNIWLVDEMYRRYQENPHSVADTWREFFEDYKPTRTRPPADGAARAESQSSNGQPHDIAQAAEAATPIHEPPEDATPLPGVAGVIATNMEASLGIPTATSVRTIPAKLL
nr:hypothetical protein [Actinomycetota bacterium]